MFKNILIIACVAMLAGCGGKKDENTTNNQLNNGGCPSGQYRNQYNNCVANNGYNGNYNNGYTYGNCAIGQVFSAQYNQCLAQGNCPVGQALYNNACIVVNNANTGYPNSYPTNYQQCQQGYVFVTQFNSCLPMMQGCPQGWGYNQSTNLCYAPANYNPYTGSGNGGFGFGFCIGTNCR